MTAADGLTRLVTGYFNRPSSGMPGNEVEAAVEAIVQIGESARLPRVAVDEWGFASESTAKGAVFAQLAEGDYRFGPGRKELRGDEEEGSSRSPRAVLEQYLPYWKAHRQYVDRWMRSLVRQATRWCCTLRSLTASIVTRFSDKRANSAFTKVRRT